MDVEMGVLAKSFATTPAKGKKGKRALTGKRLGKAEMESLQKSILTYVKANPGCSKKEIAAHLSLPSKKLFSPMKALVGSKQLTTKGVRAGMKYSIKKSS